MWLQVLLWLCLTLKQSKKVACLLLNDFLVYSFASDEACIQMVYKSLFRADLQHN